MLITSADELFSKTRRTEIQSYLEDSDITSVIPMLDGNGNTLLHHWAYRNRLEFIKIFVDYESRINDQLPQDTQTPDSKQKAIAQWVNAKNKEGFTAAHYASNVGNLQMLAYLKQKGANLRVCSNNDLNLLHMASQGDRLNAVIELSGIIELDSKDQSGLTALHWASQMGSQSVVEFLLSNNVNINQRNKEGETPLFVASREGQTRIVRKLLIKGADRQIPNLEGNRPIDIAKQYQFNTITKMLDNSYGPMDYLKFYLNTQVKYSPQNRNLCMPFVFILSALFVIITANILVKPTFVEGNIYFVGPAIIYGIMFTVYLSLLAAPKPIASPSTYKSLVSQLPICTECRIPKTERSFHCHICKVCIEQYDHHCPWINGCVGKRNIARFLVFLYLLSAAIVKCGCLSAFGLFNEWWIAPFDIFNSEPVWRNVRKWLLVADLTVTLLFVIPLLYLTYIQTTNLFMNKTTFQRFTKVGKPQIRFSTLGSSQHSILSTADESPACSFANCGIMCSAKNARHEYQLLQQDYSNTKYQFTPPNTDLSEPDALLEQQTHPSSTTPSNADRFGR